ncbi:MAG: DNA recombination protein RmuC [Phycisphaerales bacterium]
MILELLLSITLLAVAAVIVLLIILLRRVPRPADSPNQAAELGQLFAGVEKAIRGEFASASDRADERDRRQREEMARIAKDDREQLLQGQKDFRDTLSEKLNESYKQHGDRLDAFSKRLSELIDASEKRGDGLRETVEARLDKLREENAKKLDEMRATVDEKLQGTLEKRLGESFKQVSDRLEQVHKGLGEMQTLATGVGDLKRVMTNVKTRGTWGEFQLGAILEQILAPSQYESSVAVKPDSNERVEFAICLPGRDDHGDARVYLPIDAKFPSEDYQRLVEAQEAGDPEAVAAATKQLDAAVRLCAKTMNEKYIYPPYTTDFAILFVPTEGLFAEIVRRASLVDHCQQQCRVVIAGPTTLAAILNSLQMGFRTLAIQQRSSEVWEVLGAVKTEFGKFGDVIAKVKKKLKEASNTVESAEVRSRAMQRRLKVVEELPVDKSMDLLGLADADSDDIDVPEESEAALDADND